MRAQEVAKYLIKKNVTSIDNWTKMIWLFSPNKNRFPCFLMSNLKKNM